MVDPFQQMEQMMSGMFAQPPQQHQQQQERFASPPRRGGGLFDMFGGLGGGFRGPSMGNVFFMNGFPMEGNRPGSAGGCSEDFIANLPEKEAGKQSECYICLEKCKEGKESCELPCKHAFDRACLTNWLKEHDSCPVCRVKLD